MAARVEDTGTRTMVRGWKTQAQEQWCECERHRYRDNGFEGGRHRHRNNGARVKDTGTGTMVRG